jgi:ribonuclease HI
MPYIRIGGHMTFPPPLLSRVQTDGSFVRHSRQAGMGAVIQTAAHDATYYRKSFVMTKSSTEAEWAAIAFGLEEALKEGQTAIGLENDCLGIIQALMDPATPLRHAYAREYRHEIYHMANKTHWTGIRWIPREINNADGLTR